MKKIIASIGVVAALATSCGMQPAFADTTTTTSIDTSAPGTPRDGWIWHLPDGTVWGQCATGYGPQWNTVHDYTQRTYGTTTTDANGNAVIDRDRSWDDVQKLIDSGTWGPGRNNTTWFFLADIGNGTETTNPIGYTPANGELTEGDCVADGTSLPAPNDHFNGNGNSYPIITTTYVSPKKNVKHVPAVTKQITTPAHQMAVVQIDTYLDKFSNGRKLTPAQVKTRDAARNADKKRGILLYRQGSAAPWLWGSTQSKIVTVDLCNAPKLASNTDMWALGKGASKALPWGATHNVAQTTPKASCGANVSTVVVTPAHDVVTYTCPDGTAVGTADAKCAVVASGKGGAIGGSYGG